MSETKGCRPRKGPKPKASAADAECRAVASTGELTYERYYGLTAQPFSLSTAVPALYRSPAHMPAYESLLDALRRREGLIVLTGESGTGKTTLCRAALNGLDRTRLTAFLSDPSLSREDVLRTLLVEFVEESADELTLRRLSSASRLELWHQLRRFLASIEAADPHVVLVIDEAQRLAGPLLDEVRALSELEVGGTSLQIVLVGQPELQSHLKTPEMLQINQRVTTRCELRPLTREELADYIEHRLAIVGGARARVSFAPMAVDMIHVQSNGVPRLVNVLCDRAMACGHLAQTSVIGPPIVAEAFEKLQLTPVAKPVQRPALAGAATASERPRGLFEKRPESDTGDREAGGLDALLALPATSPRFDQEGRAAQDRDGAFSSPAQRESAAGHAGGWDRAGMFKAVSLVALGMVVMSIVGGFVVTAQREKPVNRATALADETADLPSAASIIESIAAANRPESQGTWAVQVAAPEAPERAHAMVTQLTELGFPAFAAASETAGRGLLSVVRVGPFKTPADAADIGVELREYPDFQGAFVVNVAMP